MPRLTQTESFWRDTYAVDNDDELALQEFFLEQGKPLSLKTVANYLFRRRVEADAPATPKGGGSYTPSVSYTVGQKIRFAARQGAMGEVVSLRPGENPRHGEFEVIEVRFGKESTTSEFASGLADFRLYGAPVEENEPEMSTEELFARYHLYAMEAAEFGMEKEGNFVSYGLHWLPTVMLVTFHEGNLNIAEAMIEMVGSPLSPDELLTEMAVEASAPQGLKRFSLNYALSQDPRFVNRGSTIDPKWDLNR